MQDVLVPGDYFEDGGGRPLSAELAAQGEAGRHRNA